VRTLHSRFLYLFTSPSAFAVTSYFILFIFVIMFLDASKETFGLKKRRRTAFPMKTKKTTSLSVGVGKNCRSAAAGSD
jgi:hypothetical protein